MNNTEALDDEIDLREIFSDLAKGKRIILACTLICAALATALAFMLTPKYEAKLIANYAKDEGRAGGLASQFGGLAELAGVSLGGNSDKEAAIAFIQSRAFLESFIEEQAMMPVLYAKQWDKEKKTWITDDDKKAPTAFKAFSFFSKNILNINSEKKSGLITITITWKDPELAANWANALIKKANDSLREKSITETQLSLDYLQKELQKTSLVEVQNTIYRVMENQIKTMMMANTQEQFAFKIIDPALTVDEDAFSSPKRPLMIVLGGFAGLFIGVLLALLPRFKQHFNATA